MKKKPRFNRVIEYCTRWIELQPETKLPPVRVIAKTCGVSLKTAHDALCSLKEQGIITARWGDGYFSADFSLPGTGSSPPQAPKHKTQELLRRVRGDILNQTFARGSRLPALKILQDRYQVSYPTIKKVLQILVQQGELKQNKKQYLVACRFSPRPWRLKVLIITAADRMGTLNIQSEQEQSFFRAIWSESMRRKLDCSFVGLHEDGAFPSLIDPHTGKEMVSCKPDGCAGYVVIARHLQDYRRCLDLLALKNLPVAVWYDAPKDESISSPGGKVTLFEVGFSTQAGSHTARHLIERGHRRIAYISPFHNSAWSQARLDGLKKEFERSCIPDGVHAYTLDTFSNDWSFMDIVYRRNHPSAFPHGLKQMLCKEVLTKVPAAEFERMKVLRDNLIMEKSIPLLEAALADRSSTAWVCANDLCAIMYLDWLQRHGVRVPGDLCLAGYDNTFEALQRGLTSYDFNFSGMAGVMLEYILEKGDSNLNKIQIPGEIVCRRTTDISERKFDGRGDWI